MAWKEENPYIFLEECAVLPSVHACLFLCPCTYDGVGYTASR